MGQPTPTSLPIFFLRERKTRFRLTSVLFILLLSLCSDVLPTTSTRERLLSRCRTESTESSPRFEPSTRPLRTEDAARRALISLRRSDERLLSRLMSASFRTVISLGELARTRGLLSKGSNRGHLGDAYFLCLLREIWLKLTYYPYSYLLL